MSEQAQEATASAEAPKAKREMAKVHVIFVNEGGSLATEVCQNKKQAQNFIAVNNLTQYKVVLGKELTTVTKTVVELA